MALCLPLQLHLPSESFGVLPFSPWTSHGHGSLVCILLVFSCFVASIPLFPSSPSAPPSLCFFQFLLQKLNPMLLLSTLPLSFSHKVWWGLHFILPAVSCLWIRHLLWRWKKTSRPIKYITFGLSRPSSSAKHHGSLWPPYGNTSWNACSLPKATEEHRPPSFPPNKAVVFISQVATMWECRGVRKYQYPKCSSHLLPINYEGPLIILHPPILPRLYYRETVLIISEEYLWVVTNLWHYVHVVWGRNGLVSPSISLESSRASEGAPWQDTAKQKERRSVGMGAAWGWLP